jgi:hypothetical protein
MRCSANSKETFGMKIKIFKARCRNGSFTDAHRKIRDEVEVELAGLLLKRNRIVHVNWERTAHRRRLTGSG